MTRFFKLVFVFVLLTTLTFAKNRTNHLIVGNVSAKSYKVKIQEIDPILAYWKELFKDQKIPFAIDQYSIEMGIDMETKNAYFYLLGTNKLQSVKVAMQVFKKGKKIIFNQNSLEKMSLICTGEKNNQCTELGQFNGDWICGMNCIEGCSKLVSLFIDENDKVSIASFLKQYR